MKKLRSRLKESCMSLKRSVELDCRCHILFANLAKWFPTDLVIKVKDLQQRIHQRKSISSEYQAKRSTIWSDAEDCLDEEDNFDDPSENYSEDLLPISTDPLLGLLNSLHTEGHILLLKEEENSWIVMNHDALFKTVNGTLFAPKDFKQHFELDNNTGVVPLLKLNTLFPDLDFDMVKQFLVHYEFCQQIEDNETLELIHGSNEVLNEKSVYYFFPGFVMSEKPDMLWDSPIDPESPYSFSSEWMLQCQSKQYFDTRFLHVLLLRLTFTFVASSSEASVLRKQCDIWKNGIHWGTRNGVEIMFELIEEKTVVLVLVRCFKGQELEAVKLRTAVLKKIWEAKQEFCPMVKTNEYLIHPSELRQITSQALKPLKISITEIAKTIIEGSLFVIGPNNKPLPLDTLLYYEPYSRMGKGDIEMLFCKKNINDSISSAYLLSLSKSLYPVYQRLVEVLKIPSAELGYQNFKEKRCDQPVQMLHHLLESWTSWTEQPTFGTLRSEFDQYSIFLGRDPLELCNSTVNVTSDSTEECKSVLDDIKHIGRIAYSMSEWEGAVGDALKLTCTDRVAISEAHPRKLYLQKRMALMLWKQKMGSLATGDNLARAFETAGYQQYADNVRKICGKCGGGGSTYGSSTSRGASAVNISSDSPPNLPTLLRILLPVSSQWMNIGVMLSLSHGRLTAIETRCRGVPDNCLREMLNEWLQQVNPRPTKSALVDAVKMYNPSLAEKISAL